MQRVQQEMNEKEKIAAQIKCNKKRALQRKNEIEGVQNKGVKHAERCNMKRVHHEKSSA